VARRAGVSHRAPYNHFPEKLDLLAAVAAVGFEQLRDALMRSMVGIDDPETCLVAIYRTYLRLGLENPVPGGRRWSRKRRMNLSAQCVMTRYRSAPPLQVCCRYKEQLLLFVAGTHHVRDVRLPTPCACAAERQDRVPVEPCGSVWLVATAIALWAPANGQNRQPPVTPRRSRNGGSHGSIAASGYCPAPTGSDCGLYRRSAS
jgi:AcrR family transcriptional regulator